MHWLFGRGGWRGVAWLAAHALCAAACGDDGGDDAPASAATEATGPEATGPDATGTGDDGPSADEAPTSSPGSGEGSSGDDATSDSTATDDDTTADPPVELCNGWREDGPDTPWLELYGRDGETLESGDTFELECGGQGSWMFAVYPRMGGWDPRAPMVTFDVVIDVDGFAGPSGHFYEATGYYYNLECWGDDLEGGIGGHACIAAFPPDELLGDLTVLDGAPATIHVELNTPDGPLVIDLTDMTLAASAETFANGCGFG